MYRGNSDREDVVQEQEACCCKAQQPNTADDDVSDPDPSLLLQAQVGDGVNDSQVALHTGQDVKIHPPRYVN